MDTAQRTAAARLIEWTGERCVPWLGRLEVVYEHVHRYAFAAGLAAGLDVLDVGSGEGYGAALIAERARHVIGVEIDPDSVAHAAANYRAPNLEFVRGSALDLRQFAGGSMGMAVCFEVVEHLAEQKRLVRELRRVVGDRGILVISTPDRSVYREGQEPNPHHVRELDRTQFESLLGSSFRRVEIWEQRAISGSLLWSSGQEAASMDFFEADLAASAVRVRPGPAHGIYLVAVASDAELPPLPVASVLSDELLLEPFRREIDSVLSRARWLEQQLATMRATRGWRALEAARRVAKPLRGGGHGGRSSPPSTML